MRFVGLLFGHSGSAAMYIKIRWYAEAGDTKGKHSTVWDECREGSRRQVPGLAAKTEEDERRRTGKRMVDLTLKETF